MIKKALFLELFYLFYKEYLKSMNSKFKGIYLLIEQSYENLDYEDIQYILQLEKHRLKKH